MFYFLEPGESLSASLPKFFDQIRNAPDASKTHVFPPDLQKMRAFLDRFASLLAFLPSRLAYNETFEGFTLYFDVELDSRGHNLGIFRCTIRPNFSLDLVFDSLEKSYWADEVDYISALLTSHASSHNPIRLDPPYTPEDAAACVNNFIYKVGHMCLEDSLPDLCFSHGDV